MTVTQISAISVHEGHVATVALVELGYMSPVAVINNLIQYQQSYPVSSIAASAARPKTGKIPGKLLFQDADSDIFFLFPISVANKLLRQLIL